MFCTSIFITAVLHLILKSKLNDLSQIYYRELIAKCLMIMIVCFTCMHLLFVSDEGLKQLLVPLTEHIRSDFALTLTAVDATFKDSVQHLADTKVGCIKLITFNIIITRTNII